MDGKLRNMATVFLKREGKILLLYRQGGRVVNDVWIGSAGGHFEPDELNDARVCVLRELSEELGITEDQISNLALRYVALRRVKGEIRQNYFFFADLSPNVTGELTSTEGICRWFELSELPALKLSYSAAFALAHYAREGMHTDRLYGGIATGEDMVFIEMPE